MSAVVGGISCVCSQSGNSRRTRLSVISVDEVGEDGLGGDVRLGRVGPPLAADGILDDAEGVLVGLEVGLAGGAVVDGRVDGAVQLHQAVAQVRHAVRGRPGSEVESAQRHHKNHNAANHKRLVMG